MSREQSDSQWRPRRPGCGAHCDEADRLAQVLHRIRLAGMADAATVAHAEGLTLAEVEAVLETGSGNGLVKRGRGVRPGWILTAEGRVLGEKLLDHQLECDRSGEWTVPNRRTTVGRAYEQFIPLNAELLLLCTRWQVKQDNPVVLNDHSDQSYDQKIIAELGGIQEQVTPVCRMLTEAHGRFGRYENRLDHALRQVESGQVEWLTKPTMDSYHTIWFELHEDLLATLGLDRAGEHARIRRTGQHALAQSHSTVNDHGADRNNPNYQSPQG